MFIFQKQILYFSNLISESPKEQILPQMFYTKSAMKVFCMLFLDASQPFSNTEQHESILCEVDDFGDRPR